jgi:hypothetical protein
MGNFSRCPCVVQHTYQLTTAEDTTKSVSRDTASDQRIRFDPQGQNVMQFVSLLRVSFNIVHHASQMTHFSPLSDVTSEAIVGGVEGNEFNQANQFRDFGTNQESGFAVNLFGAGPARSGGFINAPAQQQDDNRQRFAVGNRNSGTIVAIPLNL